jgi:micrococcal nuclease
MIKCKRIFLPALATIILALVFPFSSFAGEYQITRVITGDTLELESGGHKLTARLVGIVAPKSQDRESEMGQPFNLRASNHLKSLVRNKTADIKSYGLDRDGSMLGEVFVDNRNVNIEMVGAGLAEVYRGKPAVGLDLEPYWKAEEEAKAEKRGMWVLGDQYVSPRDWRRIQGD